MLQPRPSPRPGSARLVCSTPHTATSRFTRRKPRRLSLCDRAAVAVYSNAGNLRKSCCVDPRCSSLHCWILASLPAGKPTHKISLRESKTKAILQFMCLCKLYAPYVGVFMSTCNKKKGGIHI